MERVGDESCKSNGKEFVKQNCFIDYTEPPSLQSIALMSTAVRLWTEPDVYCHVLNDSFSFGELKERVLSKLARIILPDTLKIKISNVIDPIGYQLFETNYYLTKSKYDFRDILKVGGSVYYTMDGIADCIKSLKDVMKGKDKVRDFIFLYKIACTYCLEEDILYLWQKMSSETKTVLFITSLQKYEYNIIGYWTAYLKNDLPKWFKMLELNDYMRIFNRNFSFCQNMTSLSVFISNISALKYFWPKLTEDEKNISIDKWLKMALGEFECLVDYQRYDSCADILFFLLSKLDKSKQNGVFQAHSGMILKALFFCWPWQRFFLPTLKQMVNHLPEDVYSEMMSYVTKTIKEGKTAGELITEIWQLSPMRLKDSFRKNNLEFVENK